MDTYAHTHTHTHKLLCAGLNSLVSFSIICQFLTLFVGIMISLIAAQGEDNTAVSQSDQTVVAVLILIVNCTTVAWPLVRKILVGKHKVCVFAESHFGYINICGVCIYIRMCPMIISDTRLVSFAENYCPLLFLGLQLPLRVSCVMCCVCCVCDVLCVCVCVCVCVCSGLCGPRSLAAKLSVGVLQGLPQMLHGT